MKQRPLPLAGRPRWKLLAGSIAFLAVAAVAGYMCPFFLTNDDPSDRRTEDGVDRVAKEYAKSAPSKLLGEILAQSDLIPSHQHPLLGQPAPDFELMDVAGNRQSLIQLRGGKPMVMIFYYGYYCDHCVRQLFDVHNDVGLFRELGAKVVAISADPPETTRKRFEKYGPFAFPVLSDPGNTVAHRYFVFRGDDLRHGTFVISGDGVIRWVNVGDAPFRRNSALLYQLARMEGSPP